MNIVCGIDFLGSFIKHRFLEGSEGGAKYRKMTFLTKLYGLLVRIFCSLLLGNSHVTTYVSISVGILVALTVIAGLLKYYLFFKKRRSPGWSNPLINPRLTQTPKCAYLRSSLFFILFIDLFFDYVCLLLVSLSKGRFRRYDFCFQLLYATHVMSATRIVSSKSGVQHPHDSCTQHEKCRRILKHVLKPYDSPKLYQNVRMTSCLRSLPDASNARYIFAYTSRKQKSYLLNRP